MSEIDIDSELNKIFGTNDLLSIVGIKSKEAYETAWRSKDIINLRIAYLRTVVKNHPNSSGLAPDDLDGVKEAYFRAKKLFVMDDIFKFLTDDKDDEKQKLRIQYIQEGILPDLPSLRCLRERVFKASDYTVPEFEEVAAELKSLFLAEMKRIRELQEKIKMESS